MRYTSVSVVQHTYHEIRSSSSLPHNSSSAKRCLTLPRLSLTLAQDYCDCVLDCQFCHMLLRTTSCIFSSFHYLSFLLLIEFSTVKNMLCCLLTLKSCFHQGWYYASSIERRLGITLWSPIFSDSRNQICVYHHSWSKWIYNCYNSRLCVLFSAPTLKSIEKLLNKIPALYETQWSFWKKPFAHGTLSQTITTTGSFMLFHFSPLPGATTIFVLCTTIAIHWPHWSLLETTPVPTCPIDELVKTTGPCIQRDKTYFIPTLVHKTAEIFYSIGIKINTRNGHFCRCYVEFSHTL